MPRSKSVEARVVATGLVLLAAVMGLFGAGKIALWRSVVVHEERASIHRLFPGDILVRFPQEPTNAADLITSIFLILAGVVALALAFAMGERVRAGRVSRAADAQSVRRCFVVLGVLFVWVGFDEAFLVHELLSANFFVHDAAVLLVYAAIGGLAALRWQRALRSSGIALAVMLLGGAVHAGALALDVLQDRIGWAPEEPLEMLAAGLYFVGMCTYASRLALADLLAATRTGYRPAATAPIADLPDSAIRPLAEPAPAPAPPARTAAGLPSDPAWVQ